MFDPFLIEGFDWDKGNARKTADKHGVSQTHAEQVFFNEPLLLLQDRLHGNPELRFHALGRADDGRLLHVAFTLWSGDRLIRAISARPMSRKERKAYEEA